MKINQKIEKNNFKAFLLEGALFVLGNAFLNPDGVISVFIDTFTGRMELVGLAVTIRLFFGIAPRLFIGPHIPRIKNLPLFTTLLMALTRSAPLWVALTIILWPNPVTVITVFFISYTLLWVGHGIISVSWLDIFGRTIASRNRGKIQGYQQIIGGLLGLGAGLFIKYLLDHPSLTSNTKFGLIFGIAGITCMLSFVPMSFAKDLPREIDPAPVKYALYFKKLKALLRRHKPYKKLLKPMIFSRLAILVNPFIILVAKNQLNFSTAIISSLIFIQIAGGLVGGYVWGKISHDIGNKAVIQATGLTITTSMLAILLAQWIPFYPLALGLVFLSSILSGMNNLCWLGQINYTIDIGQVDEKTNLVILNGFILLPVSLMGLFVGGLFEWTGFTIPFILAFSLGLLSFISANHLE